MDRVRRRHLPAPGPQGRRLPARAHPRGDVHPRRQGPLLLLQGPPALDLPDPDEVPRRGATPGRAAAWSRVHHEGLLLLRRRRRRPRRELPEAPRRLHPDLRQARVLLRHRLRPLRRDGWLPLGGVPRARGGGGGHLRSVHALRLRGQRRGGGVPDARRRRVRRRARGARGDDARHAHDRLAGRPPRRRVPARGPSMERRRHAQERPARARAPRRHQRAAGHRPARGPRGRREAARGARLPRRVPTLR